MMNIQSLINRLDDTPLTEWAQTLPEKIQEKLSQHNSDLPCWQQAIEQLPNVMASQIDLKKAVTVNGTITKEQQNDLEQSLKALMPWRKGPFTLFNIEIDTEWRSNWKWERVAPHLDLHNKHILDVGCGNGYYQWRMLGAGAKSVLGIDPNLLFYHQFLALKKYLPDTPVWHLPFTLDDFPSQVESFDVVFSMGVFYHRKDPIGHLFELKNCLRPNGQLVIETLIIEGDEQQVLVPQGRYAQMRNVWFLPSIKALTVWLNRVGFRNVQCVDVNQTSIHEQRSTQWMTYKSLPDFLDPDDQNLTIEMLPAPRRAALLATK